MSLQLSKTKPRQLQYAVGGLREELKLIELDEHLLDAIKNDQCVAVSLLCCSNPCSPHSNRPNCTCDCFAMQGADQGRQRR